MLRSAESPPGTHWGAIVFTLAAGSALFALVIAPLVRDATSAAPVPIAREARSTPAPTAAPVVGQNVVAPAPEELGAELVVQTLPREIFVGTTTMVTMLIRNTGTAAWVKGTPAEARLGVIGDDERLYDLGMAVEWPLPTRPAVQSEAVVEPGATAQFAFRVKGTVPGRYMIHLAPVVDGVAWMDAHVTADITVQ